MRPLELIDPAQILLAAACEVDLVEDPFGRPAVMDDRDEEADDHEPGDQQSVAPCQESKTLAWAEPAARAVEDGAQTRKDARIRSCTDPRAGWQIPPRGRRRRDGGHGRRLGGGGVDLFEVAA